MGWFGLPASLWVAAAEQHPRCYIMEGFFSMLPNLHTSRLALVALLATCIRLDNVLRRAPAWGLALLVYFVHLIVISSSGLSVDMRPSLAGLENWLLTFRIAKCADAR